MRPANDKLVVGLLPSDKASTRSVGGELSAGETTTVETKRACRKTRYLPDSSNLHLNFETLVGCLDRINQDVPNRKIQASSDYCRSVTSGRSCSRWMHWVACSVAQFSPRRPRPSYRDRLRRAKTAPRPLNRLARCHRRFPRRLPRSPRTRPCPAPFIVIDSLRADFFECFSLPYNETCVVRCSTVGNKDIPEFTDDSDGHLQGSLECAEESLEFSTVRTLAERVLPCDDHFLQTDGDVSGSQVQMTAACSLWQKGRVGQPYWKWQTKRFCNIK